MFSDDKMYGVTLAYHFSTDLDTFAQSEIQETIPMIRSLLEEMGYKVHDERENYQAEGEYFYKCL